MPVPLLTCLLLSGLMLASQPLKSQPPTGELELSAGGFLKVHGLVGDISSDEHLRGNQELWIPHIPVEPDNTDSSRGTLQARNSRLWLRARGPDTPLGRMEILVEGDLMEDMTGYRPRLRHAYGMIGRLLAGQTWSTFTNTAALADVDSGTAVGNTVTRHNVLRWTQPLGERLDLLLALEEPLNRLHPAGQSGFITRSDRREEDIVLRLNAYPDRGNLSVSLLRREISVHSATASPGDNRHGGAISIAGRLETGGLDNLRFAVKYGNALARHSTLGAYPDAVIETDGSLSLNTVYSTLLAWQHYWAPDWRSTFALSHSRSRLPDSAAGTLTRSAVSAQANLVRSFGDQWSLGLEYLHGQRHLKDGRDGQIDRLQLTLRVNF